MNYQNLKNETTKNEIETSKEKREERTDFSEFLKSKTNFLQSLLTNKIQNVNLQPTGNKKWEWKDQGFIHWIAKLVELGGVILMSRTRIELYINDFARFVSWDIVR